MGQVNAFIGASPCTIVPYYSTDSSLVCYTPPSPTPAGGYVQVLVQTVALQSSYAPCVGGPCRFQYALSDTPGITAASLGAHAGGALRFAGPLGGANASWYHIFIGARDAGLRCDAHDEAQPDNALAAPPDALLAAAGAGAVYCTVGPTEAGVYNVSFEVRDPDAGALGWGGAARSGGGAPQARAGGAFHVAIAPRVDAVDAATSGLGGGGAVSISSLRGSF
jgi:hypothetical protein